MKVFKTLNDKISELGFTLTEENNRHIEYTRHNDTYNFNQKVVILHKASGRHILQSYDVDSTNTDGSICVGLTYEELKLFVKKFRQLQRRWK